jgi:hypothetical protein
MISSESEDQITTNLSKGAETRKNTASNPSRVLSFRGRKDLYPHVLDRKPLHLGQQPVSETFGQGAAS